MLIRKLKISLLVSLFLGLSYSCEDLEQYFIDCAKCYDSYTEFAEVKIKFTLDKENPEVSFVVYEGDIECQNIVIEATSNLSEYNMFLRVNEYYSIVAEYNSKGRVIYVVDGTELREKLDRSSCDVECYVILGDELDARLKY